MIFSIAGMNMKGMDAHKQFRDCRCYIIFYMKTEKILILRSMYKSYEVDYSGLIVYETVVELSDRTFIISNNNKVLKGAALLCLTGAVVGATNTEIVTETAKKERMIIRLNFKNKESSKILTCRIKCDSSSNLWRDIIKKSKEIDNCFKELIES